MGIIGDGGRGGWGWRYLGGEPVIGREWRRAAAARGIVGLWGGTRWGDPEGQGAGACVCVEGVK